MKVFNIIKYVLALAGVAMLIGAGVLYQLSSALHAEGRVTELLESRSSESSTYRPVVQFLDQNGTSFEFTSSTGSNPPSYLEGESVDVLYLPAKPQEAQINGIFSLWGGAIILGGLGTVFALIGGMIFLVQALAQRKQEYLKKNGVRIVTNFQSVSINEQISANGKNPFQIITQWLNPKTSEIHIFKSANIWFDPSDHIKSDTIEVLIEQNNPKKYWVDISFLPKFSA